MVGESVGLRNPDYPRRFRANLRGYFFMPRRLTRRVHPAIIFSMEIITTVLDVEGNVLGLRQGYFPPMLRHLDQDWIQATPVFSPDGDVAAWFYTMKPGTGVLRLWN